MSYSKVLLLCKYIFRVAIRCGQHFLSIFLELLCINFVGPHQDFCIDKTNLAHLRKLSCTVQLSDGVDYVGGDLILNLPAYGQDGSQRLSMDSRTENERFVMSRDKGSLVIFDSRIVHEITPITSGTRYSLVKWASGDEPLR